MKSLDVEIVYTSRILLKKLFEKIIIDCSFTTNVDIKQDKKMKISLVLSKALSDINFFVVYIYSFGTNVKYSAKNK